MPSRPPLGRTCCCVGAEGGAFRIASASQSTRGGRHEPAPSAAAVDRSRRRRLRHAGPGAGAARSTQPHHRHLPGELELRRPLRQVPRRERLGQCGGHREAGRQGRQGVPDAAAVNRQPQASAAMRAQLDAKGMLVKDGDVTPDGYVVNTAYTVNTPHPKSTEPARLLPNMTNPTIGDRLDERGISWAWYSGGWRDALAGKPHPVFQY